MPRSQSVNVPPLQHVAWSTSQLRSSEDVFCDQTDRRHNHEPTERWPSLIWVWKYTAQSSPTQQILSRKNEIKLSWTTKHLRKYNSRRDTKCNNYELTIRYLALIIGEAGNDQLLTASLLTPRTVESNIAVRGPLKGFHPRMALSYLCWRQGTGCSVKNSFEENEIWSKKQFRNLFNSPDGSWWRLI